MDGTLSAGTLLCGALILASTTAAQRLVVDINQTFGPNPGSSPAWIASLGGVAVVAADDGRHGLELWRTDATAAGTAFLADVYPGAPSGLSAPSGAVRTAFLGGVLLFPAAGPQGTSALWRTDGTPAGTWLVRSFAGSALPQHLTVVGSTAFFAADDGTHGLELWRTDGTPAGTSLVIDLSPGSAGSTVRHLAAFGSELMFVVNLDVNTQLWRTDGTAAGTRLVHDFGQLLFFPILDVGGGVEHEGILYFVGYDHAHGNELWRSDGTPAGTYLLKDVVPGSGMGARHDRTEILATSRGVFFNAGDTVTDNELWITDGTEAGTVMVADINPGASSSPRHLTVFGDSVIFQADDGVHGAEPWISDGTAAGTRMIHDVWPGASGSAPQLFTVTGDTVFFSAEAPGMGRELWRTDGSAPGTVLVRDVRPGPEGSTPAAFALYGNLVLFRADDGAVGGELWRTDGTAAGTMLVADIARPVAMGASIGNLAAFVDRIAFTADDGVHGSEPWVSDGTAAGTSLITDLTPGADGSSVAFLTGLADRLLLGAFVPGQGWALLGSDGTGAGTTVLKVVNPVATTPYGIRFGPLGVLGEKLVFQADDGVRGTHPWITDGTPEGTDLLLELPFRSSGALYGVVHRGELYFLKDNFVNAEAALWKTDGTAAGTIELARGRGVVFPSIAATHDAVLFPFTGPEGYELWRTDGTAQGTSLVLDIRPGSSGSSPQNLVSAGSWVAFIADDGVTGRDLWRSDGTAAGTFRLIDLAEDPTDLTPAGDLVYFVATDPVHGRELWCTDGTPAGTTVVRDIVPGPFGSAPTSIRAVGSGRHVLFQASEPGSGAELWVSDGTAAGTVRLSDLEPGALDAWPVGFTRAGTQIFFVASPWDAGAELHVMPFAATGASLAATIGAGCAGSSGAVPTLSTAGLPTVGNAGFAFVLQDALPAAPAALHFSPLRGRIELPPCIVHLLAPYTIVVTTTDASGRMTVPAPIPAVPEFVGIEMFVQSSVLDPVGPRLLALSNALHVVLGP